jgi:hypothetical protein
MGVACFGSSLWSVSTGNCFLLMETGRVEAQPPAWVAPNLLGENVPVISWSLGEGRLGSAGLGG